MTEAILQNFDDRSVPKKRNPGRSPDMVIEQRRQRLYKRQLDGLPARHLVLEHSSREGVCVKTAWNDWKEVTKWNDEDWQKDRENMIARLQAMRVRLFDKAVKKGQFQTAAQILDSLGKVVGESVETVNINAPELAIRIEGQKDS
ncbi:MAG: hypothetical protein VXY28_01475 [Bacteroidota bacterium]|nr:hypothetical protein [Bacteroidota bacterium]